MAVANLRPSGFTSHRRPVDETRSVVPESQVDQQHHGSAGTREFINCPLSINRRFLTDLLPILQLVLTSMHKYVPRIHVIPASDYASLHWGLPVSVNTAAFPVCSFIAVTAYAVSLHLDATR